MGVPSYGAPQSSYYQPRMYPVAVQPQPQYVPQYVNAGGRSSYRSYEPHRQTYYARPTSTYQPVSHYQPRYSRDEPTPSYQPASHYQPIRHYRSYEPTYYQPTATYQPASHYQPNRQYRSHTPNLTYHVRASYQPATSY